MHYIKQRRVELWFGFGISLLLGFFLGSIAFLQEIRALWWLAVPFLILAPILAWKATRAAEVFKAEEQMINERYSKNPTWSNLALLITVFSVAATLVALIKKFFS